ncbi:2OG-Fe(II) oxygenase [Microbispora sp. H10949]|uniref:2OG-Fe(II) oxygenase n=1 Tax=Microbispora sp. H10949 TaxID=2729111 RepID=UPI0016025B80|nr:2OG-Fe(II) oxygenase [Microbispora sp. H10949]
MTGLLLAGTEVRTDPFLHATVSQVFADDLAGALTEELSGIEGWNLHRGRFFEQYECDLLRHAPMGGLLGPELIDRLRTWAADLLMVELAERVQVVAHRLIPGQGIGLHNDAPDADDETHRLVVHLGTGYRDDHGGHLVLFSEPSIEAVDRVLRPLPNTGLVFAASDDSFHAVTPVRAGVRHSVVFSFWQRHRDRLHAGADRIAHSGGTLAQHLKGVHDLLRRWGAPEPVCVAGHLHSVYGTEYFSTGAHGDPPDRERVCAEVGAEAERLVWLFSVCARASLPHAALGADLNDHRDGGVVPATEDERRALLLIDLADTVEQLPRVPIDEDGLHWERARFEPVAHLLPPEGMAALDQAIAARRSGRP